MKIQGLAVIAIIIILPMSIILSSYSKNQIKTLQLQTQYDSKLQNATYDAIKAFQLNMSNSSTSDLANSKMRDINASVNTFYNSLASHFNMVGYGKDVLQNYVPAIVYTLYDGYYIYSAYKNTLDTADEFDENASFKNNTEIYGLKPYIYYSCRYKPNSNSDFTITYSLDSYITIQGVINGESVNKSGYLLTGVNVENGTYKYRGVEIPEENSISNLKQYVYEPEATPSSSEGKIVLINQQKLAGSINKYFCRKVNGVKYYASGNEVFAIINDVKYKQNDKSSENITNNKNAINYYKDANDFKTYILGNEVLKNLTVSDAVDSKGKNYKDYGDNNPYYDYGKIFGELFNTEGTYIEDANSNFNAHKLQVIKNSIESNLIVAIANYNGVSTSDVNFQMPKLQDYEWEQITQNISMITFLQGLNIGGKVYNGHSIVTNNINEDYVSENSIYIVADQKNTYYKITDKDLLEKTDLGNLTGILNSDFERRTATASNVVNEESKLTKTIYYYPKIEEASYNSIINTNGTGSENSISEYVKTLAKENKASQKYKLAQIYYTALGRERYGMYRVTNQLEKVQEDLVKNN